MRCSERFWLNAGRKPALRRLKLRVNLGVTNRLLLQWKAANGVLMLWSCSILPTQSGLTRET